MSSDKAYRALHLKYCALEGEMLVLKDQLTCALLQARENAEIANEFKHLMEEYRQPKASVVFNKTLTGCEIKLTGGGGGGGGGD